MRRRLIRDQLEKFSIEQLQRIVDFKGKMVLDTTVYDHDSDEYSPEVVAIGVEQFLEMAKKRRDYWKYGNIIYEHFGDEPQVIRTQRNTFWYSDAIERTTVAGYKAMCRGEIRRRRRAAAARRGRQ
jgi:hypothetical protein